jgi:hypothetical protein
MSVVVDFDLATIPPLHTTRASVGMTTYAWPGLFVEVFAQITKLWVHRANEGQFFLASPTFDLFFATDCVAHIAEWLEINEANDIVLFRESGNVFLFVLGDAALEMVGDAGVQHAGGICEDVHVEDGHWLDCCTWLLAGRGFTSSRRYKVSSRPEPRRFIRGVVEGSGQHLGMGEKVLISPRSLHCARGVLRSG